MYKSSARISLHLLPGFEFLKIKSVLYDTDNTPKNVPGGRISTEISDKLLMDFTVNFAKDIKLACQNATQYPNKLVTHKRIPTENIILYIRVYKVTRKLVQSKLPIYTIIIT